MKTLTWKEKARMIKELKVDAVLAGTFAPFGRGDEQTVAYEIRKTNRFNGRARGLIFQILKNGERREIISASEIGEPVNTGDYEHQRDLAVRYARQEGVGYGEIDMDLMSTVLANRGGDRRRV